MYNKTQINSLEQQREHLKDLVDKTFDYNDMEELISQYIQVNKMIYELNEDQSGKEAYNMWKGTHANK